MPISPKSFVFFALCSGLMSCSPILKPSLEVTYIPPLKENTFSVQSLHGQNVTILDIRDTRPLGAKKDFVMNDHETAVEGNPIGLVRFALQDAIRDAGGSTIGSGNTRFAVDITEWILTGVTNFPSTKISGKATLVASFQDKDGNVIRTGTYHGSFSGEDPFYSENNLIEAFGNTMNGAIESLVKDIARISG